MADTVKRPYRSARRAASAAGTRARIHQAAARLFVERGYLATTVRDVAAAAGVGERTLYDSFPNKAALFGDTLGVAVVGDEEPVPVAERREVRAAAEADPRAAIAQLVDYTAFLLDRAGDLIVVSVEAAGSAPEMRAAADAGARSTYAVYVAFTQALHKRGLLRPGLDEATAADILYGLANPFVHQLLRRHRHWSHDDFRAWLTATLVQQLLEP